MANTYAIRRFLLVLTFGVSSFAYAATVRWGHGELSDPDGWEFDFSAPTDVFAAKPFLLFETLTDANGVTLTADYSRPIALAYWSAFAVMPEGAVIDAASIRASSLFYNLIIADARADEFVTIPNGGSVCFGFETVKGPSENDVVYGWVKFFVDQTGRLDSFETAADLSGGAMIVGGGSALTPEPSALLLLLIGGGLVALRRASSRRR